MVCRFKLLIVLYNLELFQFAEQICTFHSSDNWTLIDWKFIKIYVCEIKGANMVDPNVTYTINTKANNKTNAEVNYLLYSAKNGNTVDFIPSSIFDTFANIEVLDISVKQNFKIMKPQYLRNATKLKAFIIVDNQITNLDENLFVEAKNLQYISFGYNKIENIHESTFRGLEKLQVLRLQGNLIIHVHYKTFSHLINLQILNLLQNQCIDQKFTNLDKKFREIETKIRSNCTYYFNANKLQRNFKEIQNNLVQFIIIVLIVLVCLFLNAVVTMVFVIRIIQFRKKLY